MRVLIDTNIFISYLLKRDQGSTIAKLIEAGFEGKYTLLMPHEVLRELFKKLSEKKYLANRIIIASASRARWLCSLVLRDALTLLEGLAAGFAPVLMRRHSLHPSRFCRSDYTAGG
jgi:predicted nucleic acid-binding protein